MDKVIELTYELKEELNWENVYRDDGQPNFHRIPKEDARRAAEEYWEWCESLTNFLEACIENNIITTASCAGHPERWKNYSCVTFDASNENTKQLIEFISETKLPYEILMRKLNKSRFWESGESVTVTIYVDLDKRDLLYNTCTEKIKKGINETWKKEKQSKSLMRSLIGLIEEYELKMEFSGSITYDVQEEQLHFNEEALKRKYIKIIDDIPNWLDYIL